MRIEIDVAESDVVVIYHRPDVGSCSMSGKADAKGYAVTIVDGPATQTFLSHKAIDQLLKLSFANTKRPVRAAETSKNGEKQHA